jgi:hypothetical protein
MYKTNAWPYSFQVDAVMMPQHAGSNGGSIGFLLLVDILSRKAFAYPLKSTAMQDILRAYKQFISRDAKHRVFAVYGDDAFSAEAFKGYNAEQNIRLVTNVAKEDHMSGTAAGNKLGIVDRLTRTLKGMLNKEMLHTGNSKWSLALERVVNLYNSMPHSSLPDNKSPDEVYEDRKLLYRIHSQNQIYNIRLEAQQKLKLGQHVRHLLPKGRFDKEGQNWSQEVYIVAEKVGYQYRLKDEQGKILPRTYRAAELSVVTEVTEAAKTAPLTRSKERHSAVAALTGQEGIAKDARSARRLVSSMRTRAGKQPVGTRVKVKQLQSKKIIKGSKTPWFESAPANDQRKSLRQSKPAGEWWKASG